MAHQLPDAARPHFELLIPSLARPVSPAYIARTPNDALALIALGVFVTAAGDDGALNITHDGEHWVAEFMRNWSTLDRTILRDETEAIAWASEWYPRLYEFHSEPEVEA